VDGPIGTCELATNTRPGAEGILTVAAGKMVYFFGESSRQLIKSTTLPYEVASVGLNVEAGRYVTGSSGDTWVRLYNYEHDAELGKITFAGSIALTG
jgi:serine-threonine kinase receptor-associated protein